MQFYGNGALSEVPERQADFDEPRLSYGKPPSIAVQVTSYAIHLARELSGAGEIGTTIGI